MRMVDLMGGKMWITSEPGKGSTFHFSVSFALPEVEQSSETRELLGEMRNAATSLG